ncbi:MAG: proprotein convertase P-domain-containing protein [Pirellulaceae bacterium]
MNSSDSSYSHPSFARLQLPVVIGLALVVACFAFDQQAFGQAGLREALERLDRDQDGEIGPSEITPLARPYLERIAQGKRLSLYRENSISDFQESARIYHARQNGMMDDRVRARPESTIRSFEPDDDDYLVPEFGLAQVKYRYTQDDVEEAENTFRRSDRNRDNFIDREEARRARWTHRDPFEMDLNKDNRLSKMELIQRYARRRMLDDAADELVQRARRVGNGIEPSKRESRDRSNRRDDWWRRGGSSTWLTASLMGRFDKNRNGRLEENEASETGLPTPMIDLDRNSEITREEMLTYLSSIQAEEGDPGEGLPGWFYELDENQDDQVSMPEFAVDWTPDRVEEFEMLDLNQDGLLTESELLQAKSVMGGAYESTTAVILPPKKTIISEIEVKEDLVARDLQLQLSITHTYVGYLDVYLTGPDGQRVELFTEVGGSGDHFQNTLFKDDARTPIVKGRAPYEGEFKPEGNPGLSHWKGKNVKGIWQLVVRGTRSERFGMLHEWRLIFQSTDGTVGGRFLASMGERSKTSEDSQQAEAVEKDAKSEFAQEENKRGARERYAEQAAQSWVNAGGPEQVKRRQEQLDRYRDWAERMKAEGKEVTGEGKKKFFSGFENKKGSKNKRTKPE